MTPAQYNPSDPAPEKDDDLATADARAFAAENAAETPKDPAQDAPVIQAGENARQIRAVSSEPRPIALYIAAAALIALGFTVAIVLIPKQLNTAGPSNPTSGLLTVPTPDSADTKGLSNQAQQDINTCSNPANAVLGAC